jgi:hypothetical protein
MAFIELLSVPGDPFEQAVLQQFREAGFPSGVLANNILIPCIRDSWRSDEHDVILLLPWAAYTVDAKGWRPGRYRVPGNGPIEWKPGKQPVLYEASGNDGFEAIQLPNPFRVAHQKCGVLSSLIKRLKGRFASYPIESVVVVPNDAEIEPNEWQDGAEDVFMRLRVKKIDDIVGFLKHDEATITGKPRLTDDELRQVAKAIGLHSGKWPGDGDITRRNGFKDLSAIDRVQPGCPLRMRASRGRRIRDGEELAEVEVRQFDLWSLEANAEQWLKRLQRHLRDFYLQSHDESLPPMERVSHPESLFVVMPWYDGQSIIELVRRNNRLPLALVRDLVGRLARTVSNLARRKLGNLGIHPHTVFLVCDGQRQRVVSHRIVSLSSFSTEKSGVSTVVSVDNFESSFVAPQLRESGHLDRRHPTNDLFSVGRLAAYCYLGSERYRQAVVARSCYEGFPEDWVRFLEQACNANASQRFADADEMAKVAEGLSV